MLNFEDKVVAITGAEMGIGKAIAEAFSKRGAKVVIVGIDEAEGTATAAHLPGKALFIKADVSKEEEVKLLPEKIKKEFGPVDILVNNAGIYKKGNVSTTSFEDWKKILDVNLDGVFLVTKYILQQMLEQNQGVIVNIASEAGIAAIGNQVAYNVSKAAVIALTKSLAVDFAEHNIRANAVCPGTTMTPLVEKALATSANPEEEKRALESSRPLNRLGKPEEIANAVLALASEELGYATGAVLSIDGGYTAV
jgi:NAD(P)-dependent dehydrogenase (short-subunit alcohol dehydrogenase family)